MKNNYFKNDIYGLFEFLTQGNKIFKPYIEVKGEIVRSHFDGSNKLKEKIIDIKSDIQYRINIIEGHENAKDKLLLTLGDRKYEFRTIYPDRIEDQKPMSFSFDLTHPYTSVKEVAFNTYLNNFLEAEKYVDSLIKEIIERDLKSILAGERVTSNSWYYNVNGEYTLSFYDHHTIE